MNHYPCHTCHCLSYIISSRASFPLVHTQGTVDYGLHRHDVFHNDADAKYDIDYYVKSHTTLIEKLWSHYGVKGWSVTKYVPGLNGAPPLYAFGSEVFWGNEEGINMALESYTVAEIMADVARFSNKPPIFLVGQTVRPAFDI